jgi:hypothetical protein
MAKVIPVTGREGPEGCETSGLPHFLDNWLTDGVDNIYMDLKTSRTCKCEME